MREVLARTSAHHENSARREDPGTLPLQLVRSSRLDVVSFSSKEQLLGLVVGGLTFFLGKFFASESPVPHQFLVGASKMPVGTFSFR